MMDASGDRNGELDVIRDLLWFTPQVRARGPKPGHVLNEVLDAAIRIADEGGLSAVTMQRLAHDLGLTKMAIYRYVSSRSQLIALMTDRAIGDTPPAFPGNRWRQKMEAWAHAIYSVFRAHPWGIEATSGQRVPGPREMAWVEAGLAILSDTGLKGPVCLDVLGVITAHLRFMAAQATAGRATSGFEAAQNARMRPVLSEREREFPHVSAAMRQSTIETTDKGLSYGIACILDGVEWQLSGPPNHP